MVHCNTLFLIEAGTQNKFEISRKMLQRREALKKEPQIYFDKY